MTAAIRMLHRLCNTGVETLGYSSSIDKNGRAYLHGANA